MQGNHQQIILVVLVSHAVNCVIKVSYYDFINVLANYIQRTQLLVKENLALTKSTGQKVHSLNMLNSANMQLQTASNMHTH